MQPEKRAQPAAVQPLDDFRCYKKKMISSLVLKDVSPSFLLAQHKGESEFMKVEAWCDYKGIDLDDRKVLALTPCPLPAYTCFYPGRKNSHLKQLRTEIHARFVHWAAEMLHCSTADSIAPSQLQYHWPVAVPWCIILVACSALKERGWDRPPSAFPGWTVRVLVASQKREYNYSYLSIVPKKGKHSLNTGMLTIIWFSKHLWHTFKSVRNA